MEKQAVGGQILILASAMKTRKNQDLAASMRSLALLTAFALLSGRQVATQTSSDAQTPSVLATGISVPNATIDAPKSFDGWLEDLRTEARGKGFSDGLIDE